MIPNRFDLNLVKMPEEKRRHYWFWSTKPDRGKTTFLVNMEKEYRARFYAKEEKYQDFPVTTEFVMIDEFSEPFLKTTQLNQMCDGTHLYPTKGGQQIRLHNPILLICSNKSPADMYTKTISYIQARFHIIPLDPPEFPPILQVPTRRRTEPAEEERGQIPQ